MEDTKNDPLACHSFEGKLNCLRHTGLFGSKENKLARIRDVVLSHLCGIDKARRCCINHLRHSHTHKILDIINLV